MNKKIQSAKLRAPAVSRQRISPVSFIEKTMWAALLLAVLLIWSVSVQAATLSFTPSSQSVINGGSVDVSVVVSGLGDGAADSLGAYDLNVSFDSALLSYTGIVFGDPVNGDQLNLGGSGTYTAATPAAGQVNLVQLSFDSVALLNAAQADSFVLAVLSFDAIDLGDSLMGFSGVVLSDAGGANLAASTTAGNISVIPVPAAFWLMLSALGILRTFRTNR